MAFHDVTLMEGIAFGSTGGPERKTQIATLGSGREERNAVWVNSRRRYNASVAIDTDDKMHEFLAFWEARNARLYSFRIKDKFDYKSCPPLTRITPLDQVIGVANGGTTQYQLVKKYADDVSPWTRVITKPRNVRIAVGGVEVTSGWSVNPLTGIVTFDVAPVSDPPSPVQNVTAGFEFDTVVRFDMDHISVSGDEWKLGTIPDMPMVEVDE